MAASQEQKLDYLLKKIGYVSSKTGIAEDENTLSGTKKAPFAEPIPSPLVVPATNIWADSSSIPSTPPGADTNYVQVYLAGSSGHRMTVDSTVSGNRTFIAYSTYNNTSTDILGDWIDPSFGSDYIIKVYKGDPNSGGVLLSAAGTASNDTWFFDYSSGVLNFNGSQVPSGVTSSNIYIVGYRYIGNKGAASPVDVKWFDTAVGIWTSSSVGIGTTNATSTLTVDGTLNVSGVSTFVGDVSFGSTVTFGDNDKIILGDGNDLQIYHDPNEPASYISDQGEGQLRILTNQLRIKNTTDNASSAIFHSNGAVILNYNNSTKFETVGTGVSISSGTASTATIYGPGNLIIDPAPVDDNGGIVRIKGDLYVDGTTTEINSTTLTIDDLNVVVASGATNGLTADGAGLSVAGAGATIKYNYNSGSEQWVFNKAPYYNTNRLLTTADEGIGNGLDADTLDEEQGTYYLDYSNFVGVATDSDKLDGQQGTYYLDYTNFVGVATDSSLLDGLDSTSFLRSDVADTKTAGNLTFNDNIQARFGTNSELKVYHTGAKGFITNSSVGNLVIQNNVDDYDVVINCDDGSGSTTEYFRADGSSGEARLSHYGSLKLATKSTGIDVTGHTETDTLNVSGISTFNDDVIFDGATAGRDITFDRSNNALEFEDNAKAIFGSGTDNLSIYHNGANSYISNDGTDSGSIYIQATKDGERVHIRSDNGSGGITDYFAAYGNSGEARLYHYGNQKFATKSNGIDVTGHTETDTLNVSGISTLGTVKISSGIVTASSGIVTYYGDGSELTNVDATTLGGISSTSFLRSDAADTKTSGALTFNDNIQARFGSNGELSIYGSSTNSYIKLDTGNLYIINSADDKSVEILTDNGSGSHTTYFRAHGSTGEAELYHYGTEKLATKEYGIDVTGHTETDTLNVSGVATATDFNSASDENLKTNIRTIEDPLAKVVQIRGVNFDWKETQRPSLGVIAQEVEKVLPELVTDNGTKTVNYNGLIGLLIETVKEQQKQIDTLSERLSKLE